MPALLYLALTVYVGYIITKRFLPEFCEKGAYPPIMTALPAFLTVGVVASGALTYALCVFFAPSGHGVLFGSASAIALMFAFCAFNWKKTGAAPNARRPDQVKQNRMGWKTGAANALRRFAGIYGRYAGLYSFFILLAVFIWWFFNHSFLYEEGRILAGFSVFSDFGPHVAVIRSFSAGNNFPAQYPHFPDGTMRYHFMFHFFTGVVEYLGMRIDYAFNILSALFLLSCLSLLYALAVRLTGKPSAGVLTIIFFLFRSSFAFFTYIFDGTEYASPSDALTRIWENKLFIGNTPHENWGLWNINVYANQRHFGLGLCLLLLLIHAFLPLYKRRPAVVQNTKAQKTAGADQPKKGVYWLKSFFKPETWRARHIDRAVFLGLLTGFSAYFHGSCVVAALGILAIMAIFSAEKINYAIFAAVTLALSVLQNRYFGAGAPPIAPSFKFGFIVPEPSLPNIIAYLAELTGVAFLCAAAGAVLLRKTSGGLAAAFLAPAVFTFTLNLTPDVTVNHKYLMISMALLNIFAAYAIVRAAGYFYNKKAVVLKCAGAAAAGIIALLLTLSGIVDLVTYNNLNGAGSRLSYKDAASETVSWIKKNTETGTVFLSHWHVQSPILLAGRYEFIGWPYFGWSAGYDTYGRGDAVRAILASEDRDELLARARANGISYVYVDRDLVDNNEFSLDEDKIVAALPLVFTSETEAVRIYKID